MHSNNNLIISKQRDLSIKFAVLKLKPLNWFELASFKPFSADSNGLLWAKSNLIINEPD